MNISFFTVSIPLFNSLKPFLLRSLSSSLLCHKTNRISQSMIRRFYSLRFEEDKEKIRNEAKQQGEKEQLQYQVGNITAQFRNALLNNQKDLINEYGLRSIALIEKCIKNYGHNSEKK